MLRTANCCCCCSSCLAAGKPLRYDAIKLSHWRALDCVLLLRLRPRPSVIMRTVVRPIPTGNAAVLGWAKCRWKLFFFLWPVLASPDVSRGRLMSTESRRSQEKYLRGELVTTTWFESAWASLSAWVSDPRGFEPLGLDVAKYLAACSHPLRFDYFRALLCWCRLFTPLMRRTVPFCKLLGSSSSVPRFPAGLYQSTADRMSVPGLLHFQLRLCRVAASCRRCSPANSSEFSRMKTGRRLVLFFAAFLKQIVPMRLNFNIISLLISSVNKHEYC